MRTQTRIVAPGPNGRSPNELMTADRPTPQIDTAMPSRAEGARYGKS